MAVTDENSPEDDSSLIIPISSGSDKSLFLEIYPEELKETPVSTMLQILQDERPSHDVWGDTGLMYMQEKHHQESLNILQAACDEEKNVRVLASTGIAHLSINDEQNRHDADQKFTQAASLDTFFPMTWMGRGMLNLQTERLEQAKFFFQTTLKECGNVLPALLGMAAYYYTIAKYEASQDKYAEAIKRFPRQSGAPARVGFGFASYKLGQVDRAKAAFQRALALDPENVPAMVGQAVLNMGSSTEGSIKSLSMANLLDHNNAMVLNHLANHYFWKWTAVTGGTVSVETNSAIITASGPLSLDASDVVRIGTSFETKVAEVLEDGIKFKLCKAWSDPSTTELKVWKKDYERVYNLAKGAYGSTTVPEIMAESLFFLARVYHVREDNDNALKFYERACTLAPTLAPARFGWAQTLIVQEKYAAAAQQLKQLTSSQATDAFALLGLLEVRDNQVEEGLTHLRKAIELDPANPDLVMLEALALQQHKTNYAKSLDRYKKAVDLLKRRGSQVSYQIYTNVGVLCHETKRYDESLEMYRNSLAALDDAPVAKLTGGTSIVQPENDMFYSYVDSNVQATVESPTELKIIDVADVDTLPFSAGDNVGVADSSFSSEIVKIEARDGSIVVELKDAYYPMIENETERLASISISVKRDNNLLDLDDATTIAFNIARLHEASGKTLAAIELQKAIVKRNPAYWNSYLRLACIAVDCGSLNECAQWLKIAAVSAPNNAEVLTLIGNLHLSLCDWKPAQKVFDGLMGQKVASVEAYSALSMGNIYFANLHVSEERYSKHLQYASDYYKRILAKDPLNAYAANGIGTVLAERGEIFKAKEVFDRVREVSGDQIGDALLNLGHIFLAQKKQSEALQLYMSYMKRTEEGTTPITSKSRTDDIVDVLLYIAFAYFDWARHTELFNDINAARADERYKEAMKHLELAISKNSKKDLVLKYNLCMTKLQAANCVLQKLTRNIPRTVEEVEEALAGLEESLLVVEAILKEKEESEKKINIRKSTLEDFLKHCRANIASAQSHLEDEKKRRRVEKDEQELRLLATEAARKESEIQNAMKKQDQARQQEERDQKAEAKMKKVEELRSGWQHEQEAAKPEKGKKRAAPPPADDLEEIDGGATAHGLFDDSSDDEEDAPAPSPAKNDGAPAPAPAALKQNELFGDDSDDDDKAKADEQLAVKETPGVTDMDLFGGSDDEAEFESDPAAGGEKDTTVSAAKSNTDLFGESDDEESDEELLQPGSKRGTEESPGDDEQPTKKKQRL